jgi:hypothetical protein
MAARWRPKKWVVVLFGCLALFFGAVAFVGCYSGIGPYDLPPKSRALEETLAVSKSLGLPMTQAELVGETPPDEENAAIEVLAALDSIDLSNPAVLVPRTGTDIALRDSRNAWLRENSKHLDSVATALAAKPSWHVDRDYDLGPYLLYPELAKIKNVAKGLMARSVASADKGDIEAALSDFRAARQLSERIGREPTLISTLVSIAIDLIALKSVVYFADAFKDDVKGLSEIERVVLETNNRKDAWNAIRGEFYMQLFVCRNLKELGGLKGFGDSILEENPKPIDESVLKREGVPTGLFARASMTSMAETWNTILKDFKEGNAVKRGWGVEMARLGAAMEDRFRASEILTMILMPVYEKGDDAMRNVDAMQDIAVAFTRAMRHRASRGSWPKGLATIDAEFDDPFSPGNPIRMSAMNGELRVWSVGRDRVDNDGIPTKGSDQEGDTVFKWPPKVAKGS